MTTRCFYLAAVFLLFFIPLASAQEAVLQGEEAEEEMLGPSIEQVRHSGFEGISAIKSKRLSPLRFNWMGPNDGAGRASAIAGIPSDTMTYYVGGASGGIWKTTNNGHTFKPIFDAQSVQSIGALSVAPSDPNVVWAGTGEAFVIRDQVVPGNGVYKSIDGGKTWLHMGLKKTGRIADISISPANPDVVYVCALGLTTGPQQERGVFRTRDGGKTWEHVLFVDPHTGCSDLKMDPNNPNVLLVGMWQLKIRPWVMITGGPGSGVYITHDGGDDWKHIKANAGLPKPPYGKVGVAIAPSNPNRMYALIQTAGQGVLWRSDDSGKSWELASWDRRLVGRAGYYMNIAVNPANPDEVLVANSSMWHSVNGGETFERIGGCGDCHDIWMDPLNPDHWAETGDGNSSVTSNHGKSWNHFHFPIGQVYHVSVDHQMPYWIYGNNQDDGNFRGPSNKPTPAYSVPSYYKGSGVGTGVPGGGAANLPRSGHRLMAGDASWQGLPRGCESGFTIPKPGDPNIIWLSCYGDEVMRHNVRTHITRSVSPWMHILDFPPNKSKYRCHWTPPLAIDPFDPNTVYYGCNVIFRTRNKGQNWTVISPDLSTQDSSRIVFSGGLSTHPGSTPILGDNLGQFEGGVVFAIAPSKIQKGLIWAGTDDGQIWYTSNGGKKWNNVTDNIKGLPKLCDIRQIYPSVFDKGKAYVSIDCHLMDNYNPFLYKTEDYGKTWTKISKNLPSGHILDYTMSIAEDPNKAGMLFAGTAHAFYYSMNDGRTWTHFDNGLPAAPVSWIVPQKLYHDVVISTYGRGIFVLRNITRLEQKEKASEADGPYLYKPRPGMREARSGKAVFLYSLDREPSKPVSFEILDSNGNKVRVLHVNSHKGSNRITWNLLYKGPKQVKFRTKAPYVPHIWEQKRFQGKETRPLTHWGIGRTKRVGPIASPGRYTVRMIVNGDTYSRPFKIVSDPSIPWPDSGMVASTQIQVHIRDLMNTTVDMINRIEVMRDQIEDLPAKNPGGDIAEALKGLNKKMLNVELQLVSKTALNSDDKWYVEANKIYKQLIWLYAEVGLGGGNVGGGAAHQPTEASIRWFGRLKKDVAAAQSDFKNLVNNVVPAFNRVMAGKIPSITTKLN